MRAGLALGLLLAACRGGGSPSEPAPAPFLPPAEVDAPGDELTTDPLPWNPAFIARHHVTGVIILSRLGDAELEDSLRFDPAGHLVERHLKSGRDSVGDWGLQWNEGRLEQLTETLPGGSTSRTTYRYDQAGRPVEIAHPDAVEKLIEVREYDAGRRLKARRFTRDGKPMGEERIERDERGRMAAAIRQNPEGDKLEERRTYQGDRLVGIRWSQRGVQKVWRLSYDPAGRITRIEVEQDSEPSGAESYDYDERGFPRARSRTSAAPDAPATTVEFRVTADQPRETP